MKWATFNRLFWNTNDCIAKFTITSGVSLWDPLLLKYVKLTGTTNAENLRQCKCRFSLIIELILAFDSSPNIFRENSLSSNFKLIVLLCFTLLSILSRIVKPILSQKSKQFHQKLYPNSFHISDCNGTRTHNDLVRKRTLNHLAKFG